MLCTERSSHQPVVIPFCAAAPAGKPIWYEIYNAPAQVAARTHPSLVDTQKYLLSLWHASPAPDGELPAVSPRTAISYFDRFRIRQPGPSGSFTLGPHIDGGSIERWEDPAFRRVFGRILEGGDGWRRHDPFDITPRLSANQDLYHAPCVSHSISPRSPVRLPSDLPVYGLYAGVNVPYSVLGRDGPRSRARVRAKAPYGFYPRSHWRVHTSSSARSSVYAPNLLLAVAILR